MYRKQTIYIVDDDPQILDAIVHLISPIEANVETFSCAEDFLGKFAYNGPSCLVLDVRMPGMSGLELHAKLIEEEFQIPVIIVTGHADVRMAVEAIKAGVANFFEKPFRGQELFDEIQKLLRKDIELWQRHDEQENIEKKLSILKAGEREVLTRIMEGKTNGDIAEELQLSVRGVEARRAKAMKTLRVDSKAELIRLLRTTCFLKSSETISKPSQIQR